MADNNQDAPVGGTPEQPQVGLIMHYTKDFSFENPNAPRVYDIVRAPGVKPKHDVQLGRGARQVNADVYEVELKIKLTLTVEQEDGQEHTVYIVELSYAGLLGARNLGSDEELKQFLLINGPSMLFPYAKHIIADSIKNGGFVPVHLDNIDFGAMYQKEQEQLAANGGEDTPQPISLN